MCLCVEIAALKCRRLCVISQLDYCGLIYLFIFTKLHISPQAILDVHKRMVVLHFWDMTAFD